MSNEYEYGAVCGMGADRETVFPTQIPYNMTWN
jgi:hypothetical protein